ncbi:MAG TPA: hypothetical protein VFK38_11390 [Candidatus Limnocylindrales bacterium]|nr:hypothetical protein [Candidatus Limnocylindrales bacterium]
MPDLSPFLASLGIALLLAFMLWFALGTGRNVRRGNALLARLQAGLPLLGRRTTLRWLGSSAVELRLSEPDDPFREVTVVVVLEPRDVSFLWLLARTRGRRDFVILRGSLRRPPRVAVEVADLSGWTGRDEPRARDEEDWQTLAGWPEGRRALVASGADSGLARSLWQRLEAAGGRPWRLSVRRTVPHLEVHLEPGESDAVMEKLVRAYREIALEVAGR